MPQSLANIMINDLIMGDLEKSLYAYIRGIADNIKSPIIETGGMPDHVHRLLQLP